MSLIYIHHLIQTFILPPFNAIIIIALGILFIEKRQLLAKWIIISGCIFLYVQSTPFFVYSLSGFFEKPAISKEDLKNSQAIVVLGGGVKTNAYEYPEGFALNSWSIMRLEYAAYLAKQDPKKIIVVSGGIASSKNHSEAEIMKNVLQNTFYIKNPILIEDKSRNTDENAKFVSEILNKINIKNVAVITQAYHTSRATALFKKYGLEAYAAPTDYMGHYTRKITFGSFIPDADTMLDCSELIHEFIGYIVYVKLPDLAI